MPIKCPTHTDMLFCVHNKFLPQGVNGPLIQVSLGGPSVCRLLVGTQDIIIMCYLHGNWREYEKT